MYLSMYSCLNFDLYCITNRGCSSAMISLKNEYFSFNARINFSFFTGSETIAPVCLDSHAKLLPETFHTEIIYRCCQFFAVVIIVVFLLSRAVTIDKSKREHGIDVKITVKRRRTTIRLNDFVNKDRGGLMRTLPGIVNATRILQPLGVGKGYSGYSGAKPSRIDPQDEMARAVVAVILPVKGGRDGQNLFILPERVHDIDSRRQWVVEFERPVERNHSVGKSVGSIKIYLIFVLNC